MYNRTKFVEEYKFEDWDLFRRFCVLCGCDYFKADGIRQGKARKICATKESFERWYEKYDKKGEFDSSVALFNITN